MCPFQEILDNAACFAAMPTQILEVIQAQLLCQIAGLL